MQEIKASNKVPNLFLLGAPKCGTTAIADVLSRHPEIFVGKKEPRYFDAHIYYDYCEDYPIKDVNEYLHLYLEADFHHKYLLDASVFNMYSEESIKNIFELSPQAKFIVVLRDPVIASKSMHAQRLKYIQKEMREVSEDFFYCWRLLGERKDGRGYPRGCRNKFLFRYDLLYSYDLYVDMLLKLIGQDRVLFMNYEHLKMDSASFYAVIFDFIGLKSIKIENRMVNESLAIKYNVWNRLIYGAANISRPIRSALGLSGGRVEWANSLVKKEKIKHDISDNDKEIKVFFEKSYLAMDKLSCMYNWPKNIR